MRFILMIISLLVIAEVLFAGEPKPILPRTKLISHPAQMTSNYLLGEMEKAKRRRLSEYEKLKTPEQIEKWQKDRKEFFWRQLGPLWEKSPLNVRITGTLDFGTYRIEKIVFESLPNFYVTATVFLPPKQKQTSPRPAVLLVCGHSENGKARFKYQRLAILGAMNGLISLSMDPVEQGERIQHRPNGKPYQTASRRHDLLGPDAILVGRNAATYFIWDMVRALDYLQTRSDVDPKRIGVMGQSGGGTQSSYIMALDERVQAASPSCYNCSLYGQLIRTLGPQDAEQCIFGQAAFGMDHPDYSIMRCPKPTLLGCATNDYFPVLDTWDTFRQAKRIYTRMHASNRMELAEMEGPHGYHLELREAGIAWMIRWLDHRDLDIREDESVSIVPDDKILSLAEPGIAALPHSKRTHDFNRELAHQYAKERNHTWENISDQDAAKLIRQVAGIRTIAELPEPVCHAVPDTTTEFVLETEKGIFLPMRFNRIPRPGEMIDLLVSDGGTLSKLSNEKLFANDEKCRVIVNLRAMGETKPAKIKYHYDEHVFGPEGYEYSLAFLLGKSMIGLRAEDLIETARFLKKKYPGVKITLSARENSRLIALHAAIAERNLFDSVILDNPETIPKFRDYVEQSPKPLPIVNLIHGVLKYYDTDNLLKQIQRQ